MRISKSFNVFPAHRLTGANVGVTDVEPRDQEAMTPAEMNALQCGQVTTTVGGGETVLVRCPPEGVTGRYIIVQTIGRQDHLTLCEVEAGRAIELLSIYIVNMPIAML